MYNSNQFKKGVEIGSLDLTVGGLSSAFTVRLDPTSTDEVAAGTPMKFIDGGDKDSNGVPLVGVAADGDVAIGARLFSAKNGVSKPGDIMQVSFKGCVQVLTAGAALDRGVEVSFDAANPGKVVELAGARFGQVIDKATDDGDTVRVIIDPAKA